MDPDLFACMLGYNAASLISCRITQNQCFVCLHTSCKMMYSLYRNASYYEIVSLKLISFELPWSTFLSSLSQSKQVKAMITAQPSRIPSRPSSPMATLANASCPDSHSSPTCTLSVLCLAAIGPLTVPTVVLCR